MPRYKKCPRCELNYILEEEDYCEVCKAELKGIDTNIEDEEEVLCPRCKQNYVEPGEKYCSACLQKMQGDWDEDVKAEVDEDLTSLSEMEEQEWADDEMDSFDDDDGFGNEADFIDIEDDFDGKDEESEYEGEDDFEEDELEKDFEEVEKLQEFGDFDEDEEDLDEDFSDDADNL